MLIAIPFLIAVLYFPGYFGFRLLGCRPSMALPLAPLLSVAVYAVLGNLYHFVGISSGVMSVFLIPALLLAAAFVAARIMRKNNKHLLGWNDETIPVGAIALAIGCGLAAGTYVFVLQLPRTDAVFQGWDNITHLNLIRAFIDSGDWTSVGANSYRADLYIQPVAQGGFYPAAWHEVCALGVLMSGSAVAKVVNAANYLLASLVYPLGTLCALRVIFGRNNKVLYSGAVISVCFAQFPWVMLDFGPIFPNLAAFCVLPAGFAVVYSSINRLVQRHGVVKSIFCIFLTIVSLGFLQPNSVFFLAILLFFFLGHRIYTYRNSYRVFGRCISSAACANLYYLICVVLWLLVYASPIVAPLRAFHWGAYASNWQAVANVLTVGYGYGFGQNTPAQLVLALLVFLGILTALKRQDKQWIVQTYCLVCIMCMVDAASDGTLKSVLCAIWYVDPTRIASMCAIAAVPLATLGFSDVVVFFQRKLVTGEQGSAFTVRSVAVGVTACFLVMNFARYSCIPGWQNAGIIDSFTSYDENLKSYYSISNSDSTPVALTQEEQDFADEAKSYIEDDAVVINDPTDGSILLYGLDGIRCYYRAAGGYGETETPDSELIRTDLKDVATNIQVQKAIQHVGARYVLILDASDQTTNFLRFMPETSDDFSGIVGISDTTPGFKVLLSKGPMRLYEIES